MTNVYDDIHTLRIANVKKGFKNNNNNNAITHPLLAATTKKGRCEKIETNTKQKIKGNLVRMG